MSDSNPAYTLVNGQSQAPIGANDRGFTLGDGLFETIALCSRRPRFWDAHCERLQTGCDRLGVPQPDLQQLLEEVDRACNGAAHGIARLTITRGPGPRGYAPPAEPRPTRVVTFTPTEAAPSTLATPIAVRWCETRLARQPALAGIKHCNRLEQVLARSEWQDPAIGEGLMSDTEGWVVEGVMSNLFLLDETGLVTPSLDACGVAGVVRRMVLQAAADRGIPAQVRAVTPSEVEDAGALFMTNAVRGITPVIRLGERALDCSDIRIARLAERLEDLDG